MKNQKSALKKILSIFLLVIVLCSSFTACSSQEFKKANQLFEEGNYKEALELYQDLGEYGDAQEKAKTCERIIGMDEKADNEFLAKIEESILGRMKTSNDKDYATLVNTELTLLAGFKEKEFYDSELKRLAEKYIEGLNIQKDALKKQRNMNIRSNGREA